MGNFRALDQIADPGYVAFLDTVILGIQSLVFRDIYLIFVAVKKVLFRFGKGLVIAQRFLIM